MRSDVRAVRTLLHGHDPLAGRVEPSGHRDLLIERILRSPQAAQATAPRRPRRAGPYVALGAITAIVALIFAVPLMGLPGRPASVAQAATPHMLAYQPVSGTASDALRQIAHRVRSLPDGVAGAQGRYQYVRTQSWSLFTRVDGRQVRSAVIPEVREIWRAHDGSGRLRIVAGAAEFPTLESRRTWEAEGRPRPPSQDRSYTAGGLAASYPEILPEEVTDLQAQMSVGHPASNGPAETFVAIADLYRDQTPRAQTRAALLDLLASVPGLELQGRTTDRAGRPALAVSVTSTMTGLPTRYTLLVDEKGGRVLGEEQVLTTRSGRLDVPVPSVISYTLFLRAGRVPSVQASPVR